MATSFQRELTTPSLAAADASASVRAIQLKGEMIGGVIGLAKEGYNMYKESKFNEIRQEAEALPREALERGIQSQEAAQKLSVFGPVLKTQQDIVKQTEEQMAAEGLSMADQEERKKAIGELSTYVDTAKRLKAASEQGMSPMEYTTRVRELTRKAIGMFPGLAPEIRKEIGSATGMQYADDYAARKYVEQMFTQPRQADQSKAMERDAVVINKNLAIPMQQIEAMRGTPEYQQNLTRAYEIEGLEQVARQSKLQTDALSSTSGPQTILGLQALGNEAAAKATIDFAKYQQSNATLFATLTDKVNRGELDDVNKTHTELQIISTQAANIISKNFANSEQALDEKWAVGALSKDDYEKGKVLLKNAKDRALGQFDMNNMSTVAKILVAHKDKSLTDQQKILSASMEFVKLFGPTELIASWYGSAADSSTRKEIMKAYPSLGKVLTDMEPTLTGYGRSVSGLSEGTGSIEMARALTDAKETPTPTPVPAPAPGITPEVKKAQLEAVALEGELTLKKLQKNPTANITKADANLLGTLLNNGVEYNQPVKIIQTNYADVAKIFTRVLPEDQASIKAAVSNTIATNSNKVIQSTDTINKMHGTTLKVGVRPSGAIGVIPPMDLLQSIQLESPYATPGTGGKRPDFGPFGVYPELKYKSVIPGKEEEFRKYVEGTKLWESTQSARVNNMVLSKAIVTGEQASKIGGEIAGYIEAKREVPSFYSNVPTAPVATAPATETGVPLAEPQMTNKDRAAVDVKALEAELKRIEKKPSWIAEAAWQEQRNILQQELVKAQQAAK
jgi:hypothetical protein